MYRKLSLVYVVYSVYFESSLHYRNIFNILNPQHCFWNPRYFNIHFYFLKIYKKSEQSCACKCKHISWCVQHLSNMIFNLLTANIDTHEYCVKWHFHYTVNSPSEGFSPLVSPSASAQKKTRLVRTHEFPEKVPVFHTTDLPNKSSAQ